MRNYQDAARDLRFSLSRVQPRVQLAFQITLAVENPSRVPFHVRGFEGDLSLESPDGTHPMGHVTLVQAMDLAPGALADLTVEVSFSCQDLQAQWSSLQAALRPEAFGAWTLEGLLKVDAYGLSWPLPVKTRQAFGGAP